MSAHVFKVDNLPKYRKVKYQKVPSEIQSPTLSHQCSTTPIADSIMPTPYIAILRDEKKGKLIKLESKQLQEALHNVYSTEN